MLLSIFNKLKNIDVLYSLVDANKRFNRLALDSTYIRDLDFTANSLLTHQSQEYDQVLDRFCKSILPQIHHQINKLTLGQLSVERILHTVDYSQLHSLSLVYCQPETVLNYLTGDTTLIRLLTNQITHFMLKIDFSSIELFDQDKPTLFALILSFAKRLIDFTFVQLLTDTSKNSTFNLPLTNCVSSTLTKLKILVNTIGDCLYLLDRRFDCLSSLIIEIGILSVPLADIDNTKKLPKLKCFSLTSTSRTSFYDDQVVPLLRRMSNLEELTLFLFVKRVNSTYIDGIHLHDEILIHMPRLNKFTFSIHTHVFNIDINIDFPSNDDIQRSFIERRSQQVGSYVDSNTIKTRARCHIYSLPYQFSMFHNLTNSFTGGMFDKVRWLIMADTRPFEHEFFNIISQSFPVLRTLSVENYEPQKNKQHSFAFITFPHLVFLNLELTHTDYVEQFFFERKTRLPRLLHLTIKYESLVMITNNFTINPTCLNFAQLKNLVINEHFVRPENFHLYFPGL